ncbi:GtrA family protein [Paenibacillus sp. JX-17]|uniref:GtrA family protein n=1 Tax=Paenibacillus lacisoli TaxID=3064525 RepID=A0ABT9C8R2_9BACL|nr:GtrA family protein [Paenibacillus sp. JX-17]MDO7905643.1 GtrA family protein [Paenibacillus sp. JX-17]
MSKTWAALVKFGVVGILNTAVDMFIFTILSAAGYSALTAQIISYSCGVLNSYLWNGRWTFRDERRQRRSTEMFRFILTNLIVLLFATLILYAADHLLGWGLVFSKITATVSGMGLNFAASRFWVFRAAEHMVMQGENERSA